MFMNNNAWLALFVLAAGPAFAQTAAPPAAPQPPTDEARIRAADKDQDGTLSRAEAAAIPGLARRFDLVDVDHDGSIDLKEVEAHHAQMTQQRADRLERRFKAADTDHDGTLDATEAASWPGLAKRFRVVDTDKDGTVDLDEVKAAVGRQQGPLLSVPTAPPPPAPTNQ
jgi:Ca2+-binding EF-hand superfamily protein